MINLRKTVLLILFLFSLVQEASAATLIKVRKDRAIVAPVESKYQVGEQVYIFDGSNNRVGLASITKVGKKAFLINKTKGVFRKGYRVEIVPKDPKKPSGYTHLKDNIRGYLGFANVDDFDDTPMVLGVDYYYQPEFMKSAPAMKDAAMSLGLIRWTAEQSIVELTVLEFTVGFEMYFAKTDKRRFFAGARGGFGLLDVSVAGFSDSETELFVAPYIGGEFFLNEKMAVGGEFRLPYYLSSDLLDFMDVMYFIGSFRYNF